MTRAEAIAAGGRLLADMNAERDQLAATQGTRAVAEAAYYPGHERSVGEIQRDYEQQQAEARRNAPSAA